MSGAIRSGLSHLLIAAVIIHERFYCNHRYAAATGVAAGFPHTRGAVSPLGRSTYCFKYAFLPRSSTHPSRLRLDSFVTIRDE